MTIDRGLVLNQKATLLWIEQKTMSIARKILKPVIVHDIRMRQVCMKLRMVEGSKRCGSSAEVVVMRGDKKIRRYRTTS